MRTGKGHFAQEPATGLRAGGNAGVVRVGDGLDDGQAEAEALAAACAVGGQPLERLEEPVHGGGHYSYTDDEQFLSQLVRARIIPPGLASQAVTAAIGTIDPARAVAAAERAYIGAFFDLHLRHRHSSLLDRPSPRYPDIQFIATRPGHSRK